MTATIWVLVDAIKYNFYFTYFHCPNIICLKDTSIFSIIIIMQVNHVPVTLTPSECDKDEGPLSMPVGITESITHIRQ